MKSQNGYKTPTSRKSQAHWDYAQSIAPDIFISIGEILGIIEIILSVLMLLVRASYRVGIVSEMLETRMNTGFLHSKSSK